MPLLEVNDLKTYFRTDDGVVRAVDGVSFSVDKGQTLGIVGESGSGKSVTCLTIMGLNNRRSAHSSGSALWKGEELLTASPKRLREIRGSEIAMIFQDPMTSLNPVHKIGDQLAEAMRLHEDVSKRQARNRALELLKAVGIPRPERRLDDYPHQFSGGMRQRVMIAMSLINNPDLLIADEPTTALDVTTQAQILSLMKRLQDDFGSAIIMVTHDLGLRPLQPAPAPVHVGVDGVAAAARRRRRAPHPDSRAAAFDAAAAERVPLPSPLPVRNGDLQDEEPRAPADSARPWASPGLPPRRGHEGS